MPNLSLFGLPALLDAAGVGRIREGRMKKPAGGILQRASADRGGSFACHSQYGSVGSRHHRATEVTKPLAQQKPAGNIAKACQRAEADSKNHKGVSPLR